MYISPTERPERMYTGGRDPVPEFPDEELLYRRIGSDHVVAGKLTTAAISFPRTSVNRGRFSEPEDALFSETGEHNGLGVAEFSVADVPPTVTQEDGPTYRFFLRHAPLADNYAHSEIRSDQAQNPGELKEPSKTVKLKFRTELCRRARIRIPAVRNYR